MMISEEEISLDNLDMLAERHKGFIIRTVSTLTGRYVSVEHDDAYIIALEGFAEAAAKYDSEKGSFLSFAKLVMESRLKNYLAKETRTAAVISLDALYESGLDFEDGISEDERRLKEEIEETRKQLRQEWHQHRQSSHTYLFDHADAETAKLMEEVRLGKKKL